LPCSLHQEEFAFEEYQKKQVYSPEYLVPTVKHMERFCDMIFCWSHYYQVIAELLQRSTWIGWIISFMIQTLFLNDVFHDDSAPIHSARTVWSWLEEHVDKLNCLPWPDHSNNTLWPFQELNYRTVYVLVQIIHISITNLLSSSSLCCIL
jgi:hypothetical protein